MDPLSVILGATSFDDALTRLDHADRVAAQDRLVAAQARAAQARFARLARALAARQANLRRLESETRVATASLEQTRGERERYVAQLAEQQRLNEAEISSLEGQARAAEEKARVAAAAAAAAATAPDPTPEPEPASPPDTTAPETTAPETTAQPAPPTAAAPVAGRTMTVLSTAYALRGTTATGIPVGPGIVAVDPTVIPLGTRMTIPGYGEGVAADTGGAIKGARIDVWVPTEAEASAWGVRTVTITLH